MPNLYIGAGDLYSGPHTSSTLTQGTTSPPPLPWCFCLFVWDQVSLHSPAWHETPSVVQPDLRLNPPALGSLFRLQVGITDISHHSWLLTGLCKGYGGFIVLNSYLQDPVLKHGLIS